MSCWRLHSQRYSPVRAVPFGATQTGREPYCDGIMIETASRGEAQVPFGATASGEAARVALRSAAEGPGRLTYAHASKVRYLGANEIGVHADRPSGDSDLAGRTLEQSGGCAAASRLRRCGRGGDLPPRGDRPLLRGFDARDVGLRRDPPEPIQRRMPVVEDGAGGQRARVQRMLFDQPAQAQALLG